MSVKTALVALLGIFVTSFSFADQMGPNGDKFYEEAAHFENACNADSCKAPYSKQVVYNQKAKLSKLSEPVKGVLRGIAAEQAQIWGDTILEGDYYSTGRTRLDGVVAYFKNDVLVGYKIQYSEKAWYTGDCGFDGSRETLKNCKEGRIVEGSYVSSDTQTYFSDEERYAEFSFQTN
ncbi:hypothetical protein [Bdellovibrio reynosensis]|uniref:MORN repeat-containing protein n=1 Tax=Bdellovibrio reynosensis TaxID=2835041 RepID=A0ABY4CAJ0_9BACT|nr:hypothetical protein [Bdellovibrio reynosensis]UOF00701.1 hypothetical protein MNR06_13445 [Bdellovibrio reynosensis]